MGRENRPVKVGTLKTHVSCLGEGHGVPQDYAEAAKWYRKAVKRGHAGAKEALREAERLAREWTAKHKR